MKYDLPLKRPANRRRVQITESGSKIRFTGPAGFKNRKLKARSKSKYKKKIKGKIIQDSSHKLKKQSFKNETTLKTEIGPQAKISKNISKTIAERRNDFSDSSSPWSPYLRILNYVIQNSNYAQERQDNANCYVQTCDQQITGRMLSYRRSLDIIQNEEYLQVADLDIIRRKFTVKEKSEKEVLKRYTDNIEGTRLSPMNCNFIGQLLTNLFCTPLASYHFPIFAQ